MGKIVVPLKATVLPFDTAYSSRNDLIGAPMLEASLSEIQLSVAPVSTKKADCFLTIYVGIRAVYNSNICAGEINCKSCTA